MKDFPCGQRFDLRFAQRDDGDGFAHSVESFEAVAGFLSGPALMIFHDGRNVASAEAGFRHVGFQRHSTEHFKYHASGLAKRRLMTEQGTGVWRMVKLMQQWGLPPPEIEERGPSLMVTLRMKRAR